jgi:hypothetical protein
VQKTDVLAMLQAARSAHIQWRARAQALVAGIPLEKEQVPVIYTDCKFGKWYYGAGQQLSVLETFRAIEEPHQRLHQLYMKIFNLLFGEDDRSTLKKIFGSKKKYIANNFEEAQRIMPQLIGISETLLEAIEIVTDQVRQMSDEEFTNLILDNRGRREGDLRAIN